jgi:hypothetical protein
MLIGMSILAVACIYLGVHPEVVYNILPNADIVKASVPVHFADIYIHHFGHVITKFQMLATSALVFFLFLPILKLSNTISLDIDWLYRVGTRLFFNSVQTFFSTINRKTQSIVVDTIIPTLAIRISCTSKTQVSIGFVAINAFAIITGIIIL